ncbi:hypothetical protein J7I97_20445 [Streptomyces sp. ISL-87]|uniref:hypothetical protein n=1 Tax=Streptomyces sp. ISL-87 TaxID=2819188 RepID=UPI001BE5C297|nr:hypothetical protein [Streptomyces sp. ISL-87]MBT2610573.1 hypothetical protein [Streptomyces sp. ISL-87]
MRQIEVRDLYEGAVILDGFRPATVTALETRSAYTMAVRLHSTGQDARTALYSPADTVLLCVVPVVAWRVHHKYRDRSTGEAKGGTHSSSRLSPVDAVRRYWAYGVDHQTVVRLEEEHTVVTSTPVTLDQLPGEGQPTPQAAEMGDRRFYRLHGRGPVVLRTGDDVRQRLATIAEIHDREHGKRDERGNRLAPTHPARRCSRCVFGPNDLEPVEVVITRRYRDIDLSDLPQEWDYELSPAMAHARITAASQ